MSASPRPPDGSSRRGGLHVVSGDPGPSRAPFRTVWSPWLAVLGVAVHFVLRFVLDSWLNAPSDAKFAGAVFILALPLVFSAFALVRAIRGRPGRSAVPPKESHPKESSWP
jgi:hypothetical protein